MSDKPELTEEQQTLLDNLPDEFKDTTARFLPWVVLNQFMIDSYRIEVVRTAMTAMGKLGGKHKATVERMIRKHAKVPGFRNAAKAPMQVRIQPAANVFKAESDMTAAILALWADANSELRGAMGVWLKARGWKTLPAALDRTVLPGWLPTWPENEDLQDLGQAFIDETEADVELYDACLMLCIVSGRLPVDFPSDDEDGATDEAEAADEPAE